VLLLVCPNVYEALTSNTKNAMEFRDCLYTERICAEMMDDSDGDDSVDARGSERKRQGICYEGLVANVLLLAAIDKAK